MSTTATHPIKVTTTAHTDPHTKGFRDNEISKIPAKTGKVTAVVAVMTVFGKHKKLAQCKFAEIEPTC